MLGLCLDKLKITSVTSDGTYLTEIPFSKGLNVIRAENSSGKSTCINSIAYVLGLDAILGPSRRKPFPRSMHQVLESSKSDATPHSVQRSFVELQLSNNAGESVRLLRDVKGDSDKITVFNEENIPSDFFLGSSGTIGSAKSEKGFHYWLERFIGWSLPELTTHEGKPVKLYLECIFPLFFIEQKRGWSELQANTPTYYGIKGVKKSALEFCLGVESYRRKNRVSELNALIRRVESEWGGLISSAESLADFGGVKFRQESTLEKESFFQTVSFKVLYNDKYSEINDYINGLKITLKELQENIKTWPKYDEVAVLNAKKRSLSRDQNVVSSKLELLLISIESTSSKLNKLDTELDSYKQLKRLHDVGSELSLDLSVTSCPICESDMYDSLARVPESALPLSIQENIDYLKKQIDFYIGVKKSQESKLKELKVSSSHLQTKLSDIQNKLENLKMDESAFLELYGQGLKKKIEIEKELYSLSKLEEKQRDLNSKAQKLHANWHDLNTELKGLRGKNVQDVSRNILNTLKTKLIQNLKSFGYQTANQHYLQISEQTLRPELDGYDIVADSSASDYIRIIWSYTLSLLELGIEDEKVKHSGFVVFDEPRQHETDKASFASLLEKASSLEERGGQVIVATSISKKELEAYRLQNVNAKIFDDGEYILQKAE